MINKMKIGTKLISGFALVAIIAALIGVYGIINMRNIDDRDTLLYQKMTLPIQYLAKVIERYHRVRVNVYALLSADTQAAIKKYKDVIFGEHSEILIENLNKFKKTMISDKIKNVFKELQKARSLYRADLKRFVSLIEQGKKDEARAVATGVGFKHAKMEQKALDKLMQIKIDDAKQIAIENTEIADSTTLIMVIVLLIGFLISLFLGIYLTKSISKPLTVGVDFANKISKKDLTAEIDKSIIKRGDEVGMLANALIDMKNNLIEIVNELNDVANNMAASSEEISASAQSLASGAQNQAASVEETSASMEELGSSITQVASNADDINNKSNDLLVTSKESAELVEDAVTSMDKINESSVQISDILGVINDISDQTNLLALNAAIEAARAGEHGRGFAVVADEISKLADKSTENAKEIETLIKQSIKDIDKGSDIVKKAGDAFNVIIQGVGGNSELIVEIAKAIEQQKEGSDQVQTAVENINEITQSTSASAEEMAASTEEMQSQAENIKGLIEQFKVSNNAKKQIQGPAENNGEKKEVTLKNS